MWRLKEIVRAVPKAVPTTFSKVKTRAAKFEFP